MMNNEQMQEQLKEFLNAEAKWQPPNWHHAWYFIRLFMLHCNQKVADVKIRKLCKSIRKAQRGHGATVLSTIEDGYVWSDDTDAILANANYWRQKALSRLETAADIKAAISTPQQTLRV